MRLSIVKGETNVETDPRLEFVLFDTGVLWRFPHAYTTAGKSARGTSSQGDAALSGDADTPVAS